MSFCNIFIFFASFFFILSTSRSTAFLRISGSQTNGIMEKNFLSSSHLGIQNIQQLINSGYQTVFIIASNKTYENKNNEIPINKPMQDIIVENGFKKFLLEEDQFKSKDFSNILGQAKPCQIADLTNTLAKPGITNSLMVNVSQDSLDYFISFISSQEIYSSEFSPGVATFIFFSDQFGIDPYINNRRVRSETDVVNQVDSKVVITEWGTVFINGECGLLLIKSPVIQINEETFDLSGYTGSLSSDSCVTIANRKSFKITFTEKTNLENSFSFIFQVYLRGNLFSCRNVIVERTQKSGKTQVGSFPGGVIVALSMKSFVCDSITLKSQSVSFTLENFQFQPYRVVDQKFSKGSDCHNIVQASHLMGLSVTILFGFFFLYGLSFVFGVKSNVYFETSKYHMTFGSGN